MLIKCQAGTSASHLKSKGDPVLGKRQPSTLWKWAPLPNLIHFCIDSPLLVVEQQLLKPQPLPQLRICLKNYPIALLGPSPGFYLNCAQSWFLLPLTVFTDEANKDPGDLISATGTGSRLMQCVETLFLLCYFISYTPNVFKICFNLGQDKVKMSNSMGCWFHLRPGSWADESWADDHNGWGWELGRLWKQSLLGPFCQRIWYLYMLSIPLECWCVVWLKMMPLDHGDILTY